MSDTSTHVFLRAGLTGLLFFLTALAGLTQTVSPDGIAILWPANAVLLTTLLMTSWDEWPLLTVAALVAASAACFAVSFPLWSLALFGLVNIFEVLLAATLIRLFAGKDFRIQSVRGMTVFFLAAPLIACSLAALLAAAIHEALDRTENPLVVLWQLRWFADAVGLILFTPLLISAWNMKMSIGQLINLRQLMSLAELAVIWAGIAITGIIAFRFASQGDVAFFLAPVLLALVIWTATRFGLFTTTLTVTLIAVMATAFLVQPTTLFTTIMRPQDAILLTQEYLIVMSTIAVGFTGVMQKVRQQRASLRLQDRALMASNDAISIVDVQQAGMPVSWVNPRFEELFGFSAEEVVGRNWGLLQEGIRQQFGLETVSAALAEEKPCRTQLRNYTKKGESLWIDFSVAPVSNDAGRVTHYVGIHHDVTEAKATEERLKDATEALQRHNELLEEEVQERTASLQLAIQELEQVASVDFLTGVANRRYFYEIGQRELTRLQRDGRGAALIAFDLDNFKAINDAFGHEAGDLVLKQIVMPVEQSIRPSDSFGRVGGDEFLILFSDTPVSKAVEVAERIRAEISEILSVYGSARFGVTASFGVAGWDKRCDLKQLVRQADLALYRAKAKGRNSVCTWHPELDQYGDESGLSNVG
jgi:diguanylate cyclase (GGDEF)-like protein/PAS domain S-box-containing protein